MNYAAYASAPAHKLLTDNRDLYIAQSKATTDDRTPAEAWEYARQAMQDGSPEVIPYADRRG